MWCQETARMAFPGKREQKDKHLRSDSWNKIGERAVARRWGMWRIMKRKQKDTDAIKIPKDVWGRRSRGQLEESQMEGGVRNGMLCVTFSDILTSRLPAHGVNYVNIMSSNATFTHATTPPLHIVFLFLSYHFSLVNYQKKKTSFFLNFSSFFFFLHF